jgi:hypothetical protein
LDSIEWNVSRRSKKKYIKLVKSILKNQLK